MVETQAVETIYSKRIIAQWWFRYERKNIALLHHQSLLLNRLNDPVHFSADLWVKRLRTVFCQYLAGFGSRPIASVVFLCFPFTVWTPVHQLGHKEFTHVY